MVVVLEIHGFDLFTILAAFFLLGAFTTVFNPAEQSIIPALVDTPLVADANGLVRSSRSAVQFVGAAIGGVPIVSVGPIAGVAANALTFAVSAILLVGMSVRPLPGVAGRSKPSGLSDVREGFRRLARSRGFLELTISATFFNFCQSLIGTFIVVYATILLHGSALVFAALLATDVAGIGVGSILVSRTRAVRWAGRAWTIGSGAADGAAAIVLALFPSVPGAPCAVSRSGRSEASVGLRG